jgi:protoporphyrinogen/coproporphyrinogen III oxidase
MRNQIVVVGGGIAGLTAAYEVARSGRAVLLLEGSPQLGGKLQVSEVGGVPVDAGAEAMLARRPEGLRLIEELGLADRIVHPGTTSAAIWSRGALHPMPTGHVMGVPADLAALAGSELLSPAGMARVPLDLVLAETARDGDVSVARFIGARLGHEVVDRLVEPLLGGVYAGRTEELSFDATLGGLATAARGRRSLIAAARAVQKGAPKNPGPVFATITGGLGSLPGALARKIVELGGEIRTNAMVRELRRVTDGWRLTVGPAREPEFLDGAGVVVATPGRPAERLLTADVPAAAAELARIEYASMAIVTLAYADGAFPERPAGSGYLVPAVEATDVKAVTFATTKWPHLAGDVVLVRCSIGRHREEHSLQRPDEELKAAATAELARSCGVRDLPIDARVTRWGGGLPQYTVGHLDRVARIRAAVAEAPGLAVCGAAYDGLGIPACIGTGRSAAARVVEYVSAQGELTR